MKMQADNSFWPMPWSQKEEYGILFLKGEECMIAAQLSINTDIFKLPCLENCYHYRNPPNPMHDKQMHLLIKTSNGFFVSWEIALFWAS